jgi:hypothetical protein
LRTVAAAAVLASCNGPYDLTGSVGADRLYVDATGAWRVAGEPDAIWTGPVLDYYDTFAAPGNFDGEGRWEPAVVDIATGTWTTGGARGTFVLPPPTDDDPATGLRVSVVPADYDGDGDTDPAYYTSDTGTWYIEGEDPIAFGRRTDDPSAPTVDGPPFPDIPVPADYDGDGDADLAVYRVETGEFLVQGQGTIPTGIAYGQPVPADYTPEPGAEAAVMGMYGEGWAVEGEPAPRPYPITTTVVFAVPADYDGDGTAELASIAYEAPSHEWRVDGAPTVSFPLGDGPATITPLFPLARGTDFLFLVFTSTTCVAQGDPRCP